jgi:hypothetical protein
MASPTPDTQVLRQPAPPPAAVREVRAANIVNAGWQVAYAIALCAAALVVAGCGGGTSRNEASIALHNFDNAAIDAHNAVLPHSQRVFGCSDGATTYPAMSKCVPAARAYVSAENQENRRLDSAYRAAPDYVRRIYGAYYRAERRANQADQAYSRGVLAFTTSAGRVDVAASQRALATMRRTSATSKRLEARADRLLDRARAERKKYVKSL